MCLYVLISVIIYAGENIDIQSTVYTYAVYIYIDMLYKYNIYIYISTHIVVWTSRLVWVKLPCDCRMMNPAKAQARKVRRAAKPKAFGTHSWIHSTIDLFGTPFFEFVICWCPFFFLVKDMKEIGLLETCLAKWRWLLTLSGEAKAEDGTKDGDKKECLG